MQRDTNPDLAFSNRAGVRWRKTGETLGSDHCVLEMVVPLRGRAPQPQKQQFTDWSAYREALSEVPGEIGDIDEWASTINDATLKATTEIEADDETPQVDSRLAHLMEARNSLRERWKRQRHNRALR